jgi:hypothetical protein
MQIGHAGYRLSRSLAMSGGEAAFCVDLVLASSIFA